MNVNPLVRSMVKSLSNSFTQLSPLMWLPLETSLTPFISEGVLTSSRTSDAWYEDRTTGLVTKAPFNLLFPSEDFVTSWSNNVTVTPNTTIAPDGTATADTLDDTSAGVSQEAARAVTGITDDSAVKTASCYFKAGTSTNFQLLLTLSTGTPVTATVFIDTSDMSISGGTNDGASVESVGDGWFRVTVNALNNASGNITAILRIYPATAAAALDITKTGTIIAWGAMVEEKPTDNLLTFPEAFDNADWIKANATISADAVVAPDGTTTADKLVEDATASVEHRLLQGGAVSNDVNVTFSCYVKKADYDLISIRTFNLSSVTTFTRFNVLTGAIDDLQHDSATITALQDGWFRLSVTFDSQGGAPGTVFAGISLYNGGVSYSGDGSSGNYIWGAKLNEGGAAANYIAQAVINAPTQYIQTVAAANGAARFEDEGVLIEEPISNLAPKSQEFDDAAWTKTNSSISADAAVAPDGTTTADELIEDATASAGHYLQSAANLTVVTATRHTLSIFAKANTRDWIRVTEVTGVTAGAYFDLTNGVVGTVAGTGSPTASIEAYPNGWYRCSLHFDSIGTLAKLRCLLATGDGGAVYSGDGASSVYIWGGMAEALPFASSYLKTEATAVARTADNLSIPAAGNIAPDRINLALQSEDFTTTWVNVNSDEVANDAVAPDGTTTADKITALSTASIAPIIYQTITSVAATTYTYSIYVKAAEAEYLQVTHAAGHVAGDPRVNFDLATGVVGTTDSGITASIAAAGDYYRITVTVVAAGTTLRPQMVIINSATDTRYQANSWTAGDGLHVWGAQLEASSSATTYIPTTTAAVNATEGTVSFEFESHGQKTSPQPYMLHINDGTDANSYVFRITSDHKIKTIVTAGGVPQADYTDASALALNTRNKIVLTYKLNELRTYVNGIMVGEDLSVTLPTGITTINIGSYISAGFEAHGHYKNFKTFARVLTASEVATL